MMKNCHLILCVLSIVFCSCKNYISKNQELRNQNALQLQTIKILKDSLQRLTVYHGNELYGVSVKPDFKNLKFGDTAIFSVNVNYGRPHLIQEIAAGKLLEGEDIFTSNTLHNRKDFQTIPQNFEIGSQKIKITNYQKGKNRLGGYLKIDNYRSYNEYPFVVEYEVK